MLPNGCIKRNFVFLYIPNRSFHYVKMSLLYQGLKPDSSFRVKHNGVQSIYFEFGKIIVSLSCQEKPLKDLYTDKLKIELNQAANFLNVAIIDQIKGGSRRSHPLLSFHIHFLHRGGFLFFNSCALGILCVNGGR